MDARRTAHTLTAVAIRNGELIRQPCEVCGESPTDAHHEDYHRPLDVHWLCRRCHADWHTTNRAMPAPPVIKRGRINVSAKNALTVEEVAHQTGLHIDTVRRYARTGKIKARLVGGLVYVIPRSEVAKIKAMMDERGWRSGRPRKTPPEAENEVVN